MPRDPSEIYHTMVEELRQSASWFLAASDNSNKLSIASYALCKLISFLDADPTIFREGLTAPFGALAAASCDRAQGGRPALFECGVAPHRPTSNDSLKAACMLAIDVQMPAKIPLKEAAGIVADELKRGGCVVECKKILRWRKDFPRRATVQAQDWWATLRSVHPAITNPTTDRDTAIQHAREIIRNHLATGM